METRHSDNSSIRSKSNQQIKVRNPFELLISKNQIIRLPNVCAQCGYLTRMKEISDILESFDTITSQQIEVINEKLIQKSKQIVYARQQLVKEKKNDLQQSLSQLIQIRQSMGQSFSFEDREKCLERVCEDIFCNTQEQIEIQNSLSELNVIIQDQYEHMHSQHQNFNKFDFQDNIEIKERLEGALRINQSHKEILKEILIKIGEENKSFTFDIQLQFRQQQIEMLNLLQTNQDQILTIQKLEEQLNNLKYELQQQSNNSSSIQQQSIQSIQQSKNIFQDIKNISSSQHQKENSIIINSRYGDMSTKFHNSKTTSLIAQINKQVESVPLISPKKNKSNVKASIDTNPMMSQESFNKSDQKPTENSPEISSTSRTLLSQVPVIGAQRLLHFD